MGTRSASRSCTNEIHAAVTAFIDNDNSTGHRPTGAVANSVGAMTVSATDNSSDTSSSEQTSINTPLNDGGAGLINHYADLALDSYQYTDQSGTQGLSYGDKVWVDNVTIGDIVGQGAAGTVINAGDVVENSDGKLYIYAGSTPLTVDFSASANPGSLPNFNDTSTWTPTVSAGTVYEYMGPGGTTDDQGVTAGTDSVDLGTGNIGTDTTGYANLEYWKPLTQNEIVQAAEIDVVLGVAGQVTNNSDIQGGTLAIDGIIDFNHVVSSTTSYVQQVTITAGSLAVDATDSASITATDNSVMTTGTIGGADGGGDGGGGAVTTNQVLGNTIADIENANVTTTSGDASFDADNTSSITATETAALNVGGVAGSGLIAFNDIGWSNDDIGSLAADTLLGTSSALGTKTPDLTQAYIDDSTVLAHGSVNVTAADSATITSDAGDVTASSNGSQFPAEFRRRTDQHQRRRRDHVQHDRNADQRLYSGRAWHDDRHSDDGFDQRHGDRPIQQ